MPNTINISKNMRFFVYIIGTKHPKVRTYVGWSNDVKKRLKAHNESKGASLQEDLNGNYYIKRNYLLSQKQ